METIMVPVHVHKTNDGCTITIMYMPHFDGPKDEWLMHPNCEIIELEIPNKFKKWEKK